MKIELEMTIGFICCSIVFVLLALVIWLAYRNKQHLSNHPIVATTAIVALIISVITVVYLFFGNYSIGNISFNYSDASIAALSILTAFLVGWNIWSTIDNKGLEEKFEKKFKELESQENYDLAMVHNRYAQLLSLQIESLETGDIKALMVHYVINSIIRAEKITNQSDYNKMLVNIDKLVEVAKGTFNDTDKISKERAREVYGRFNEIKNQNMIEKLKELKEHISKYI